MNSADFEYFCQLCGTHVLERTKHCATCNRCVECFDHHCNWLNNCIGRKNYWHFIMLLFLVLAICLYQGAVDVAVIATLHSEERRERLADFYSSTEDTMATVAYVLIASCLLTQVLFALLVVQLLLLHRWLSVHEITTYEYILYLRQKDDNPELKLDVDEIRKRHKSKVLTRVIKDEPQLQEQHIDEDAKREPENAPALAQQKVPTQDPKESSPRDFHRVDPGEEEKKNDLPVSQEARNPSSSSRLYPKSRVTCIGAAVSSLHRGRLQ